MEAVDGMKVVLANGVFDLLHIGHVWHLEAARKLGDVLWVSVTDDAHVRRQRRKLVYPQEHRTALVKSLRCVDKAITVSSLIEAIDFVKPNILVKGIDYRDGLDDLHTKYCRDRGIEIVFTDTPKYSARQMIEAAQ